MTVHFNFVSREHAEFLQDQLTRAMQIVAVLTLSEEETEGFEGVTPYWLREMRADLLSEQWRPELLQALRTQGFLTNSHPGFFVSPLTHKSPNLYTLSDCFQALEEILQSYVSGEGDALKSDYAEVLTRQLVDRGFDEEVASWVLGVGGGKTLACEARMRRFERELELEEKTESQPSLYPE